ncbi:hypothetical protein D3C80_1309220 [compost metagenome]
MRCQGIQHALPASGEKTGDEAGDQHALPLIGQAKSGQRRENANIDQRGQCPRREAIHHPAQQQRADCRAKLQRKHHPTGLASAETLANQQAGQPVDQDVHHHQRKEVADPYHCSWKCCTLAEQALDHTDRCRVLDAAKHRRLRQIKPQQWHDQQRYDATDVEHHLPATDQVGDANAGR